MSYPLSSPVVEGQATEAAQYNNLRSDALYLGGNPEESGNIRDLLFSSSGNYSLIQEGKTVIKMPASAAAPVGLMIGGGIYSADSNLTLTLNSLTTPDPGRYDIYANGSAGALSLSLSAGEVSRIIGSFCWDGVGIIPGTLRSTADSALQNLKTTAAAAGRLTLVAGDPVPDADISFGDYLYFVPYKGNEISVYLFGKWEHFSFQQISLSRTGITNEIPYDVFITADSDGLKLSVSAWVSATGRIPGTLQWQDGVRVSGSDTSKRYIGSFVLNSSGYFEDSAAARLLYNENNQVSKTILNQLSTSQSHGTNHMNVWTPYFDNDAPFVRILVPNADAEFTLEGVGIGSGVNESNLSYLRGYAVGILRDPAISAPYTGNMPCSPVLTYSFGNSPIRAKIENYDSGFIGYHAYYLGFWTNYSFTPEGKELNPGMLPGLQGQIKA